MIFPELGIGKLLLLFFYIDSLKFKLLNSKISSNNRMSKKLKNIYYKCEILPKFCLIVKTFFFIKTGNFG